MSRGASLAAGTLAVVAGLAVAAWWVTRPSGPEETTASLALAETLGGADTAGYARALEPRPFRFPADHGPHPDFRTEWWYVTGTLESPEGSILGYQLTVFRSALAPPVPPVPAGAAAGPGGGEALSPGPADTAASAWATRQAYMAHLAVTDGSQGRFISRERFARGAAGLAGAETGPVRVWLEDWTLEGPETAGGPWRLRAADDSLALDLVLRPRKPPVLQGEEGLSRKGPEPGNASYYYSLTRMATAGEVRVGDVVRPVRGTSWMDREWSTSVLPEGTVGWDWFALHLDDGTDVMLYRLRRPDGSTTPFSQGVVVGDGGAARALDHDDFEVRVQDTWTSPETGIRYPAAWTLRAPALGLELEVEPVLGAQEWTGAFRYWEGAVRARGRSGPGAVTGRGYVELTGYGSPPPGAGPALSGRAR